MPRHKGLLNSLKLNSVNKVGKKAYLVCSVYTLGNRIVTLCKNILLVGDVLDIEHKRLR